MKIFKPSGGKTILDFEVAKKWVFALASMAIAFVFYSSWNKQEEAYVLVVQGTPEDFKSAAQVIKENRPKKKKAYKRPRGVSGQRPNAKKKRKRRQQRKNQILVPYTQGIFIREEEDSPENRLATGTVAVGTTLHGIDTRAPDMVRVLLPHGIKGKHGRIIPRESVLFGNATPRGDKIFFAFERVVFPSGGEFPISAHALDSKDFSAGVMAKRHGNLGAKLAAAMGFNMLGTMGEVMAEKEALGGEYGRITVKSTLKDAALSGVSEVSNAEAQRRLEKMNREAQTEYLTLPAGSVFLITLTETFRRQKNGK